MLLCLWVIVLNLSHYNKLLYLALLKELRGLIVSQTSSSPASPEALLLKVEDSHSHQDAPGHSRPRGGLWRLPLGTLITHLGSQSV